LRRLRGSAPRVVLVVCHGNICRSPYAAALLRRALPQSTQKAVRIVSAGFSGPGRSCPQFAIDVAATRGFDLSQHRSQPLTSQTVGAADLIVVMERGQGEALRRLWHSNGCPVLVLGDLDPNPIDTRQIEDPVEQSREIFERSYSRIERCVQELAAAVRERSAI
jgi:protein-tyrosine phosphatase